MLVQRSGSSSGKTCIIGLTEEPSAKEEGSNAVVEKSAASSEKSTAVAEKTSAPEKKSTAVAEACQRKVDSGAKTSAPEKKSTATAEKPSVLEENSIAVVQETEQIVEVEAPHATATAENEETAEETNVRSRAAVVINDSAYVEESDEALSFIAGLGDGISQQHSVQIMFLCRIKANPQSKQRSKKSPVVGIINKRINWNMQSGMMIPLQ